MPLSPRKSILSSITKMNTPLAATTNGVTIEVDTQYEARFSHRMPDPKWVFSYRIKIMNNSPHTLQLIRRYWEITDSVYGREIVMGEGVVGQQPILEPGQSHTYTSACHLNTPFGRMRGYYEMEKTRNGSFIKVEIPEFTLEGPSMLN